MSSCYRPRIGFAGVGWIGLNRLRAVAESGAAQIVAITDASAPAANAAREAIATLAPEVSVVPDMTELLARELDGVVIATPSGLHAEQAAAALKRDTAVFCQKPLARCAAEAQRVIAVARQRDRLLGVDFCYRTVEGVDALLQLARGGELGEIFAVDLTFHNAYGPDKPWFYDRRQSGGGCVMDLGIHLLDLALLVLGYPRVERVTSRLHSRGRLLTKPVAELEDHAFAEIHFVTGATARVACSWRLAAGKEAVIEAAFYGTRGAAALRNINGSFYDFSVEHCVGTSARVLARDEGSWGGRAACAWVGALSRGARFDSAADHFFELSALIDAIYGNDQPVAT